MKNDKDCSVYFIRERGTQNVKIGVAKDVNARLKDLQTGNANQLEIINTILFPTEEDAYRVENLLHKKYISDHIRGEWFKYREDFLLENISNYINKNVKQKREPLEVNTLYGEKHMFGFENTPRCFFYGENMAQIMQSYETSLNLKVPFRTMDYPTNGEKKLLPYSHEINKVFISSRKHKENLEYNKFISEKQKSDKQTSIEIFMD